MSFFHFACLNFIETRIRELPPVAYTDIYARDGLRCTNPFCTRRDSTPHHIRFRAHGGAARTGRAPQLPLATHPPRAANRTRAADALSILKKG
jgi:hypothetical protein